MLKTKLPTNYVSVLSLKQKKQPDARESCTGEWMYVFHSLSEEDLPCFVVYLKSETISVYL